MTSKQRQEKAETLFRRCMDAVNELGVDVTIYYYDDYEGGMCPIDVAGAGTCGSGTELKFEPRTN